jgi:tetratricopeptide (TPR) repeat protein
VLTLHNTVPFGPGVDICALGAILYELLTGRPPFIGESPAATEQQVITQEVVPPSRWQTRIPRDLETICLKCLEKNPTRRYASAQDLADDLHRFLDGKPVLARPVGSIIRIAKWARRRPAFATLIAALVVSLTAGIGSGVWLYRHERLRQEELANRQTHAQQAIEAIISKAYESGRAERWQEAGAILDEASSHLANANSEVLVERIAHTESDLNFAQRLNAIRQSSATYVVEKFQKTASPAECELLTENYYSAFSQAGFDVNADPEIVATRIRETVLSETTVSALDEWALASFLLKRESQQKKLLKIASLVQADSDWAIQFRDPDTWSDKTKLIKLAEDASAAVRRTPAHQLAITANLLGNLGAKAEGQRLLRAALRRRPTDFWLNWDVCDAYWRERKFKEAVPYLRILIALRPDNAPTMNRLGCALVSSADYDEGIEYFREALEIDPQFAAARHNIAIALIESGRITEALAECRQVLKDHPKSADAAFDFGMTLTRAGRHEESIEMYERACELNPTNLSAFFNLGAAQRLAGHPERSAAAFQKVIELDPQGFLGQFGLSLAYHQSGKHAEAIPEYERVMQALDPKKPTVASDAELVNGVDSRYLQVRTRYAESLLCLGRFAESQVAAQEALGFTQLTSTEQAKLRRQLAMGVKLSPHESQVSAFLTGGEVPADLATQLALAEWCYQYRHRPVSAVRFYESAFRLQPTIVDEMNTKHRIRAASAAAYASRGATEDAAGLDEQSKSEFRRKALQWLRADCDLWIKRNLEGKLGELPAFAAADWQRDPELAVVRDELQLAKLPESERKSWLSLWADVKALAVTDGGMMLSRARSHIARKEWADAADCYVQLRFSTAMDGEGWYEYAAVQLLVGDVNGYERTCQQMLNIPRDKTIRTYLVAQSWTLAADTIHDSTEIQKKSEVELQYFGKTFWSLTEQGALLFRMNRSREAVSLFEKSLSVEAKPGAAVLNWLWLALAHHKLGDPEKAREWQEKARKWLDSVGPELPSNAEDYFLHRHNWLEAHILRREVESLHAPTR